MISLVNIAIHKQIYTSMPRVNDMETLECDLDVLYNFSTHE